jgi:putative membrane protein
VSGPAVILITLIAGWCFLGLEALVGEVGGVFGGSGECFASFCA